MSAVKKQQADITASHVGDRLKVLRAYLGLTREQLADELDTPLGTLRGVERGNHLPGYGLLSQLAIHPELGQYAHWILNDETDSSDPVPSHTKQLNKQLFNDVLVSIENALSKKRKKLPVEQKAELVAYLYDQLSQEAKRPKVDMSNVIQLVDFAFGVNKKK